MLLSHTALIDAFKTRIPRLVSELHKGQCGRVGIVGGSKEYTGAPYFAGISALRVGCDLCYVISSKDAAPVIKSYSPELIVYPLLDNSKVTDIDLYSTMTKMHSIVIGPGLGRSDQSLNVAKDALIYAKKQNMPIIIDADGLFMINQDLSLVKGYKKCILTPNLMEFKRLHEKIFNENYEETVDTSIEKQCEAVSNVAKHLGNLTILKKGQADIISDGEKVIWNDIEGSNRRCSGQGDILSGALGVFAYWAHNNNNNNNNAQDKQFPISSNMLAAYNAATLVKLCNKKTFNKMHRSMLTTDIINEISSVFYNLYDSN